MIYEGETILITARFSGPISEPATVYVRRPSGTVEVSPMTSAGDTRYEGEYTTSEAGVYNYRIETEQPIVVAEGQFRVLKSRVI